MNDEDFLFIQMPPDTLTDDSLESVDTNTNNNRTFPSLHESSKNTNPPSTVNSDVLKMITGSLSSLGNLVS